MSWSNWGVYCPEKWNDDDPSTWTWQLDHIIPHSSFMYTSMEDSAFQECWALSNLRPLSAKKNIIEGARKISVIE
jgi:5-methylcytosine-specific restriction endonuclease McrA